MLKDIVKNKNIDYDIEYFVKNPITLIYLKDGKEFKKFTFKSKIKEKDKEKEGKGECNIINNENLYLDNLYDLYNLENENENDDNVSVGEYMNKLYKGSGEFGEFGESGESRGDSILDIILKQEDKNINEFIEYNTVYPFDSILDFKYKIQILTGIEWFKLCLFWYDDMENELVSSYTIFINNFKYKVNYANFTYDNHLSKNKNNYVIKSLDEFETLDHLFKKKNMTFYFTNIDDFIDRNKLLNNKYEVETMYYSFILKFFPQFTYDLFYNYIYVYNDFKNKYNNLFNISLDHLKKDNIIVNKYIKNYKNNVEKLDYKYFEIYFNDISRQFIKLRNIFEIFHINENDITFIFMKLGNETYKKKHKKSINFKEYKSQEALTYNYINLYIKNKYSNVPIFLRINENANFKITLNIDIMYNIEYNDAFDYLKETINPIIEKLNKFKDILLLNTLLDELEYENVNLVLSKSNIINNYSDMSFTNFENYNEIYNALLLFPNIFLNVTKDLEENISFHLKKGITSYNKNYFSILHPNINNYYSKFSSLRDMESWNNSYKGVNIKLIKNQNIIHINYYLINQIDISFVALLINSFIANVKLQKNKSDISSKISSKNIKKLNKLKLIDPIMYSFKKSKHSRKKYSKMCQKPFHPLIYTEEEHKYLDDKTKKELVPFVNATSNDQIYYHCNNKNAPYLGFIINEHPKDFCIPCCRVKEQKDKEYHSQCLKNKVLDTNQMKKTDIDIESNMKYILQNIEPNRYSYLSNNLNIFFNKFVKNKIQNTSTFYLYGLNDLNDIFKYVFYKNNAKLLFLNNENISNLIYQHDLKINIIIIDKFANLNIEHIFDYDQYMILYENNDNSFYPIIEFETQQPEQTINVKRIFDKNDKIIIFFNEIINDTNNKENETNIWSFAYVKKNYNIKKVLINNRNLIYGVVILFGNDLILYPVDYYYNNTNYESFNIINNNSLKNINEENIVKFLKKTNLTDDIKYYIKDIENYYFSIKLKNKKIFYFNQTKNKTLNNISDKYINFPLYFISEKILKNEIEFNIEALKYNIYYIYYKNLYKLVLQEITYYFSTKKNIEKRNLLTKLFFTYIKNYEGFYKQIINNFTNEIDKSKLLNLFNLLKNIQNLTKSHINELLYKIKFNFDEDEKSLYISDPTYEKINYLLDEVCVYVSEKDLTEVINKEFLKNILLPCSLEKSNYCKNNKLLMPKEEKNNIINLIINDLKNPIRKNIIFSTKMIIDDPYLFNILPFEEIIIS